MGPLAQSVRELKSPPDLSAFTPPTTSLKSMLSFFVFAKERNQIFVNDADVVFVDDLALFLL